MGAVNLTVSGWVSDFIVSLYCNSKYQKQSISLILLFLSRSLQMSHYFLISSLSVLIFQHNHWKWLPPFWAYGLWNISYKLASSLIRSDQGLEVTKYSMVIWNHRAHTWHWNLDLCHHKSIIIFTFLFLSCINVICLVFNFIWYHISM